MPRMTNTYMLAGQSTPQEIIESVDYGIFAPNFGGGQVDITSGDVYKRQHLDRIRVDSRLTYEALLEFTAEYIPEMTSKLEHYSGRQQMCIRDRSKTRIVSG